MRSAFDENGYAIIDAVLNAEQCEAIASRVFAAGLRRACFRNLLHDACCVELALCLKSFGAIAEHLPATAVAVQCTLFGQVPDQELARGLAPRLEYPCTRAHYASRLHRLVRKGGRAFRATTSLGPRVARSGSGTSRRVRPGSRPVACGAWLASAWAAFRQRSATSGADERRNRLLGERRRRAADATST